LAAHGRDPVQHFAGLERLAGAELLRGPHADIRGTARLRSFSFWRF
jgi:hypothetical protein